METRSRRRGLTLTEMTVVIAGIVVLVSFALPAVRAFLDSLASTGTTRSLISAALASARAIAAKEQRYAGIRFQMAHAPEGGILDTDQYMIFIVYEVPKEMGNDKHCFRAVEGLKPIKLPESVGVMDLVRADGTPIIDDGDFTTSGWPTTIADTTTFSIVFSPTGRLIIREVQTRNHKGKFMPSTPFESGFDDIFNSGTNIVDNGTGMFIQDDYPFLGLGQEPSRNRFVIYDKKKFRRAREDGRPWSGYLAQIAGEMIYINPYTGTIISAD